MLEVRRHWLPLASVVLWFAAATAHAADTGDSCAEWGVVRPVDRALYQGEFGTFEVGKASCGDVATCEWWADDDLGSFQSTTGSPVNWQAPTALEDCTPIELRVWAACSDGDTLGSSNVSVRCTAAQIDALEGTRDATVGGGGCNSPPSPVASALGRGAALALLVFPVVARIRRSRSI